METPQNQSEKKKGNNVYDHIFRLLALLIIVAGILFGLHMCTTAPVQMIDKGGDVVINKIDKTLEVFNKHLASKEAFKATFGPIVSQQSFSRLQFFQRNQVCLFRIVRYRGEDKENHDYVEYYKKESDKKDISNLPILLKQYCEWEAKGTYEFNFYVDMSDLSKWNYKWDPDKFTLTLYPPDIEANTPAELEPVKYKCIADSVSIDEKYTQEELSKAIPDLKNKLAVDQKQFMYNEARTAIEDHYRQFLKLIPNVKVDKFPEIIVLFPHEGGTEGQIDRSKL